MKIKAAVVLEPKQLTIDTVELDAPKAGELLVKIRAAGVCHSDLHTYQGELRTQPPLVLGHEGAGVVEAVGPGVSKVKAGDHILVNWLPSCQLCPTCMNGQPNLCERFASTTFAGALLDGTSRLSTLDGLSLKQYLSASTMAEYVVISEASAIPIPNDVPFEVAAIIGCAVMTGVGAVINTGKATPGSSAAVIGCGGIGLSMIQGCQLAGCHPIIAVDVLDSKLEFARQLGATDTINGRQVDAVKTLRQLTRLGPDYVFDSVGAAVTISQALQAIRPGGTAVIAGLHAALTEVPIPAASLILQNKSLLGSFYGSGRPQIDLPKLVNLYRAGRLQLDQLISQRYPLEELPQAFHDMEAGHVARGIIVFD
jgi:S-(hydroxymethyl)glutathione dehydrogenase/alcohol dehydrogenase